MYTYKKTVFIILFALYSILSSAAELRKAEVVSNGDRGLALEWIYGEGGSVYSMTTDENGSVYILGEVGGTGVYDCFVSKYTTNGNLVWKKKFHDGDYGQILYSEELICKDNRLYFIVGNFDNDFYFEQEKIKSKDEILITYFLFELDAESGNLLNSENFALSADKYTHIYVGENQEKIITAPISDGEYKGYGYGIAYPKFEGLNDKCKTETRTHGKTDYYFAKLDKDNNLIWDFALGGDGAEHGESWGSMDCSINGDTMYVYLCYYSDSLDIDPDPNHEEWIHGQKYLKNRDSLGIVLIRYDISGEQAKLMSYKEYDWSWFIDKCYINSHPDMGTYMSVENPAYRIEKDGDIYKESGEFHLYAKVDDNCNINVVDTVPPSGDLGLSSYDSYLYDEKSNFYITNSRVKYSGEDPFPITLNFTKDKKERVFDDPQTCYTCVSKFDTQGAYLWSLVLKNITASRIICSANGFVAFSSAIFLKDGSYDTDYNPNPDKQYITTREYAIVPLYRETYRIAVDPAEHGEVSVPDTFGWHGCDYEIGVKPDEGYHLETLTANGEVIKADADGKYYVKNITAPVCVNAKFAIGAGINDIRSKEVEITPNLVDKTLSLKGMEEIITYSIIDMTGRIQKGGGFEETIDVSELISGRYQIILKGNNKNKKGTFIKK